MRWGAIIFCFWGCGTSELTSEPPDASFTGVDAAATDSGDDAGAGDSGAVTDSGPSIFDPHWTAGPGTPPSPVTGRWGAVTVYLPGEDKVIIHGGAQYPDPTSGQTWVYDRRSQTWSELYGQDPPPPRYCHCGVYLPETHELLLINGRNDRGPLPNAAWTLDLNTQVWTSISGDLPPGTIGCNAVYDPTRRRAVIFGGQSRAGMFNQTHVYEPTTRSFSRVITSSAPPSRRDALMIYDPVDDKVWLHAGQVMGGHLQDTWSFDGAQWRPEILAEPLPPARRWGAHGLDARGNWVFFGGTNEDDNFNDIWLMNLRQPGWRALTLDNTPEGRAGAAYVWLPDADSLWIFGGLDVPFLRSLSDGWYLNFSR